MSDEDARQLSGYAAGEAGEAEELLARIEDLESRVKRGAATLEDFGELARSRQELARRAETGDS